MGMVNVAVTFIDMPAPALSGIDSLRIRFIEVCDAVMRDNPKVRSVKSLARSLDTPYLSLHKVYNYRKYKTSYPSSAQIQMICEVFKQVNPDYIITGSGNIYRDMGTESKIEKLERQVADIQRKMSITTRRGTGIRGVKKGV